VIGQIDDASWIAPCLAAGQPGEPVWRAERMIVHRLDPAAGASPLDHSTNVRLLSGDDPLDHLPPGLRHEMTQAQEFAPVAAVFVDGRAASFCYPCWTTETLWDVSIDTLEAYRGRALAAQAVRLMVAHMRRRGREPVWCALESNGPSLRLAARLGFVPIDEFVVFARGPWALLTGGFSGW
jgi:hypothetical protein